MVTFLDVDRFICDFSFECRNILRFEWLFDELGQILHGHLEVSLIVFEYVGLVVLLEVVCLAVGPHERRSAVAEDFDGSLEELHFDPG